MGSCAAPSAKGDDKFITTDYLQQCRKWPGLTADNRLPLLEGTLHAGFTVNHHLFAVSINLLNT
ncbi:hypothetical protein CFA70_27110 (plasmid) [Citrobacter freundii]|nr:hypothetical protein CFA70_27110 [Citrobacter freundii]